MLKESNECTFSPERKPKPGRKGRKQEFFTADLNNEVNTRLHVEDTF